MAVFGRQIGVFLVVLLGAVAFLAFSPVAQGEPAGQAVDHGPTGAPYAAGELLVTYEEEAPDEAIESLGEEAGAEIAERLPEIEARVLEFPEIKSEPSQEVRERALERVKEELERDPAVESVEYNYLFRVSYTPNDPRFDEQWGLRRTSFEDAWNTTKGSRVKIAVVDSGAAVNHVDLRQQIALTRSFTGDGSVEDRNGHGTHVAGTVAAMTSNAKGVAGGCPSCKLYIAKALGNNGSGTAADIADAIIWSADKNAQVINLSFGSRQDVRVVRDAVNYAARQGVVLVGAAGNLNSSRLEYPAAYASVIAVAATNDRDRRARFSNHGDWVDIAAPGVDILSTVPGDYKSWSGTSMATPHVSALAGLLASQGIGPAGIKKRIFRSAVDLGPDGRDPYFGHGRIDAAQAVS